jgi:hypothetical protein
MSKEVNTVATSKQAVPRYWDFVRAQREASGTAHLLVKCERHDLSNCASCARHDTEADMAPGARVTPRDLPPGITVGEQHFAGSWDQHTPFRYCRNPLCCDPVDTLRRQS